MAICSFLIFTFAFSFEYPIRPRQDIRRSRQANLPDNIEINGERDVSRWLNTFERGRGAST